MTNNSIIEWTDEQMTLLIKERKNKKMNILLQNVVK